MKRFLGVLTVVCLLATICVIGTVFSQGQSELANPHKVQHRLRGDNNEDKNKDEHPGEARAARPRPGNGISYHGGPVMLGTTHVYYIWYGNWSGNSANAILTNLAQNIGGSPYFNINTTYYDCSNKQIKNAEHDWTDASTLYS